MAEAFEVSADLRGINEVILVKVKRDKVVLMLLNLLVFSASTSGGTSLSSTVIELVKLRSFKTTCVESEI